MSSNAIVEACDVLGKAELRQVFENFFTFGSISVDGLENDIWEAWYELWN
jgi:hypothetical protein